MYQNVIWWGQTDCMDCMALAPHSWNGASRVPHALPLPSHGSAGSHDLFRPLFSALFLCEFLWKPFCLFLGVWSLILVLWKSTCTVNSLLTYGEKDKD